MGTSYWFTAPITMLLVLARPASPSRDVGPVCPGETLQLSCDPGEVVKANIAGGARAPDENVDCKTRLANDCMGEPMGLGSAISDCIWTKQNCSIELPSSSWKLIIAKCPQQRAQYLVAENFVCVDSNDIYSLSDNEGCKEDVVTVANLRFVQTQNYPNAYPDTDCSKEINTTPGFGLQVLSLLMDFPSNFEDAYLQLEFGDGELHQFRGKDIVNMTVPHRSLKLTFKARKANYMKGIMLQISAIPLPPTALPVSATSSYGETSDVSGPSLDDSTMSPLTEPSSKNLVLAVCAVVLVIVVIVLAVGIYWLYRRGHQPQESHRISLPSI